MYQSVSRSSKEEGIVKGLITGAVSGLSGLFSGGRLVPVGMDPQAPQMSYPNYPQDPNQMNYPGMPNAPNMNMPPQQNPMGMPFGMDNNINNNYNVEFYQSMEGDQDYSSAK